MSIQWIDLDSSSGMRGDERDDEQEMEEDDDEEEEEEVEDDDEDNCSDSTPEPSSSSARPRVVGKYIGKIKREPKVTRTPPAKRAKVMCDDCGKGFHPAYLPRHQASSCRGRKPETLGNCKFCDKLMPITDLNEHYSTCLLATCDPSARAYARTHRAKSHFHSRKVIDIMVSEDGTGYHTRIGPKEEVDDEISGVMCPECAKVFTDHQGRDEHLVYTHHYHFRIRFNDRPAFQRWFKGMRFDQIMYKANMSTVNNVTYEYYFCLHTAVNRRVRIRDRCPCRAFVKENETGITVSYLDVHSHPQLKYKRYMTEECRALILSMLEAGKKNFDILLAVRERYSESSINYTIARTTINSIRFKYKKKVWAQRNVDIKALQDLLDQEVEAEKRQIPWWTPDADSTVEQASQTDDASVEACTSNFSVAQVLPCPVSTREEKEAVLEDILGRVLPSLEAAVKREGLNADQLHTARVHLSKVARDLNPDRPLPATDHDYTYLGPQ